MFIAATLVAVSSFAQQPRELPSDPEVRKGQLDNGLTYYIRHNDKPAERAEFYLATNVGAIQETPEQDGLAHFLEHMCFNGTKNFPGKSLLEYLQKNGVEFGRNINASTGVEQTIYMLNSIPTVREGLVDTCILIMHDYSHFVTCDPVEIDNERGVIIEEKRTRNTAAWRMFEKSQPYLYGDSKYAKCTIIGSQENLETFKPETLVDFYHTWYRPDNQALIIVGDVDVDRIESKIKEIFADIPAPINPEPKVMPTIPDNEEPVIGIITDPEFPSTTVEILWKIPPTPKEYNNTDAVYANNLIKDIIYLVMAERFGDIASASDAPFLRAQFFIGGFVDTCDGISASYSCKEGEAIPAFKAVMTEIEKMVRYGFTQEEVGRAKDEILSQLEQAVEAADSRKSSEFIQPLINNFFDNDPYMEPEFEYELAQQFCSFITAEVINQAMAMDMIPHNNMIILYEAPQKEGLVHPTEAEFLAAHEEVKASDIQPNEAESAHEPLLDSNALAGSAIKKTAEGLYGSTEWTLKNGVKVVVLPTEYKKDEVIIQLKKMGGTSIIATEDLPSFESNIKTIFDRKQGVSKFPKTTLDKMLAGNTARVGFTLRGMSHILSASSAPKDIETAFQLLYLRFVEPRFDQEEWNSGMTQLASILPNYMNNPDFVFNQQTQSTLYNSPRLVQISQDVMAQASLETYKRVYTGQLFNDAGGAVVYIVGNVDLETLQPLVEKYIGSLPKGKKASEGILDNTLKTVEGRIVNEFSTSMQAPKNSVMNIYTAPYPYTVKNEVACDAIDYIIGMVYTDTLREDEGGTYGAGVNCALDRLPEEEAMLLVQFDTRADKVDVLRDLAKSEFAKLATEGPSEEYFARAIENMKKNLPESRIRNSYWLSNLIRYQEYNEDFDTLYEAAINELTADDVKAAASALSGSGNLIEIVMNPTEETPAEE